MTPLRKFAPLAKVDLATGTITGVATSGLKVDRQGERLDYSGSKDAFRKWSSAVSDATGGRSLGNLREMHQPVAAGYLTGLNFDDARQTISIAGKVVDQNTLRKCEMSVLNSLSIGGSYASKRRDPLNPGALLYIVGAVHEISLVDYPALDSAQFELTKRDGSRELRKFARDSENGQFVLPSHAGCHDELVKRGFEHVQNTGSLSTYAAPSGHSAAVRGDGQWFSKPHRDGGIHHGFGPVELGRHLDGEAHAVRERQRLKSFLPYRNRAGEGVTAEEAVKGLTGSMRKASLADVVAAVETASQKRPRVLLIGGRL